MKSQDELLDILRRLIEGWEDEVVEFKRGGAGFSTGEIGEYFSALSNEANLRGCGCAWLVFGVNDKARIVCGSDYDASPASVNKPGGLKYQITQRTDPAVSFNAIYEICHPNGKVILFEIPAAPKGIPIAWNGHYYARSGENLVALGLDKLEAIRRQGVETDWTAKVVEDATMADIDEKAIAYARERYAVKHAAIVTREQVESWPLESFLDRARLTRDGKITRAALLLVGKELSAHKLSPYMAQLVWKLVGEEQANEIFRPPYLLATTRLYSRIRNVQVRMVVAGTLTAVEVPKYSDKMVLEALHNCIAHQDYGLNGRVIVTEYVDRLTLENQGNFFFGKPEDYVGGEKTPPEYRNQQLVDAMSELNMIDTMGYGIHRMFEDQRRRYMPMHDYELTDRSVKMTIYGHFVDEAYSSLLVKRPGLKIEDVCLLDRIQKGLPVTAAAIAHLRREGMVEGRIPHLRVSAKIAAMTGEEIAYTRSKIRHRPSSHLRLLIKDYLEQWKTASRKKLNELLLPELSVQLTHAEKMSKISNILAVMRRNGEIENVGTDRSPMWRLTKTKSS